MEYRKPPKGEEQISILGLGTSSIGMAGEKEIEAAMTAAQTTTAANTAGLPIWIPSNAPSTGSCPH